MNIESAKKRIAEAVIKNQKLLNLASLADVEKLDSKDFEALLPEIKKIEGLSWLCLDHNNLTNITALKELTELQTIYLGNNNLSDISPLKDLMFLEQLRLVGNVKLENKLGNLIANSQNPKAIIRAYLDWDEAKKNNTLTLLNEAKIILIGQGNVGKSSLRTSLAERKCEKKQKKTEGLEVVEWDLKINDNRTVKFNIWDFGGQEIYHTTHQYFFDSRCLYLLVVDYSGRVEWRTNRFGYWLNTIQMLAKEENNPNKPVVIVVGNKSDEKDNNTSSEESINNEIEKAKEKYENLDIIGFFPVSCHKQENIYLPSE
jgi:internalin A